MVTLAECVPVPLRLPALAGMFEARKRVFVDLLKWDVPVLEDRYEVDQFDDEHATYLIVPDEDGGHAGSARLLPTLRPHILDTLFPDLCAAPPPRGHDMLEITLAPPPLTASGLDMRDGHPAGIAGTTSEVLTPRRRITAQIPP
jgi:acyl-homoserine lactone synthase